MGVYHVLARGTMDDAKCSAGNFLQRTALTTSIMRQWAKRIYEISVLRFERTVVELKSIFEGRTTAMRVRGMTTAEAVIKVLYWKSLTSDRVLGALYER